MEKLETKLKTIESWWLGKNTGRPLFKKVLTEELPVSSLKWENEKDIPNFETIIKNPTIPDNIYLGEACPTAYHLWGERGTPMTMSAYLGGEVLFRENSVWVEPVVKDWQDFKIRFDKENYWVQISRQLMEKQAELCKGDFLISLPDLGDALTCMSLLRGTENMLFDVIEKPNIIKEKIKEFTDAWIEAHTYFYEVYKTKLSGDCSWLLWAPGKTYACQCDFSTMISPDLFEELVVFELERMKDYLEYIIWHLDGFEEVRHLDILLGLPYIKSFQIATGAGNPPCASDKWLPIIRKIVESGRTAYVYASNEEEVTTLVKNLPPEKLFIDGGIPGNNIQEVDNFIKDLIT